MKSWDYSYNLALVVAAKCIAAGQSPLGLSEVGPDSLTKRVCRGVRDGRRKAGTARGVGS